MLKRHACVFLHCLQFNSDFKNLSLTVQLTNIFIDGLKNSAVEGYVAPEQYGNLHGISVRWVVYFVGVSCIRFSFSPLDINKFLRKEY
jgi:hypothetical protein